MYLNHGLTEDFKSIQKTIGILNAIDFRLYILLRGKSERLENEN